MYSLPPLSPTSPSLDLILLNLITSSCGFHLVHKPITLPLLPIFTALAQTCNISRLGCSDLPGGVCAHKRPTTTNVLLKCSSGSFAVWVWTPQHGTQESLQPGLRLARWLPVLAPTPMLQLCILQTHPVLSCLCSLHIPEIPGTFSKRPFLYSADKIKLIFQGQIQKS